MAKHLLIVTLLVLYLTSTRALETVNGKIKITVGTTAGCGDTTAFLNNQLVDTYAKYKEFLTLEFVPWGRTVWHEDNTFTCQFSTHNCWANRVHRCVINELDNEEDQLEYMVCEFNSASSAFNQGSYACAEKYNINMVNLDYCVNNPRDDLDRKYEARGTELTTAINFIPSIVLNDDLDVETHWEAFERLETMVCVALARDDSNDITSCTI